MRGRRHRVPGPHRSDLAFELRYGHPRGARGRGRHRQRARHHRAHRRGVGRRLHRARVDRAVDPSRRTSSSPRSACSPPPSSRSSPVGTCTLYGTTPEALATVAATIRNNGHVNPEAVLLRPRAVHRAGHPRQPHGRRSVPPPRLLDDVQKADARSCSHGPTSPATCAPDRSTCSAATSTTSARPTVTRRRGTWVATCGPISSTATSADGRRETAFGDVGARARPTSTCASSTTRSRSRSSASSRRSASAAKARAATS